MNRHVSYKTYVRVTTLNVVANAIAIASVLHMPASPVRDAAVVWCALFTGVTVTIGAVRIWQANQ